MFGINRDAHGAFNMSRQSLLISSLYSNPILLERFILRMLRESFQQRQILKPFVLGDFEHVSDERA